MNNLSVFFQKIPPSIEDFALVLIKALLILAIGIYVSKFISKKIKKTICKKDPILGNFISQVVFIALFIIVIITMLSNIGVQTTSILTIIGTAGVAIALALKDSLSSIAGGIILIILRPFKKNDTIEIGSIIGNVESINLFNTTIRLPDDKLAILPNRNIANANIINCTDSDKRRIEWVFHIKYTNDIEQIRQIIQNVISKMDKIDPNTSVFIGVTEFGSDSLSFTIRVWAKIKDNVFAIKSELIEKTQAALNEAKIQISPQKLNITLSSKESQ
ncbi:mechanosensitive ion channel family protein [Helicobacter sp. 13S00477-4]|uniref:mechanosensitive ion channel family protein n=1 Tax=Helicobacter sp. 13S00477-4 TaxID=1905759 RepID=UPI000BA4F9B4|nr:mechanosensitive ion channel family protein [Helicobacter sp. 13S00477-4]PAF52266.1 mechanosensitive ion channel protein [Helicobacter sp. 13S00477-4]